MDVAAILADLDDHGFADTSTTRKLAVLNETYQDMNSREPWRYLEKVALLDFDGSSPTPSDMPADFVAALGLSNASTGQALSHVRIDLVNRVLASRLTQTGVPSIYYFEGGVLKVWKVPAAGSNVLRMPYIHTPADLVEGGAENTILLPKRFHRGILVNGALYKLYLMEDDPELSAQFERLYEKAIDRARNSLHIVQYDEPDYVDVDPEDLYYI